MEDTLFELPPSRRRIRPGWALALSLVLHASLLLFVGVSMPFLRSAPAPRPAERLPEQSLVQFAFAQVPEPKVEQPAPPPGDVPIEVPAAPKPERSADLKPPPPDPGEPKPAKPVKRSAS